MRRAELQSVFSRRSADANDIQMQQIHVIEHIELSLRIVVSCCAPGWLSGEELTDFPSGKAMWQVYASAVEAPEDSS